jgi:hypothetical protein
VSLRSKPYKRLHIKQTLMLCNTALCCCCAHVLLCCLQFTKKGKIEVDRMLDEEEVIEAAINADVDDVEV